jgi:hypothetical protein
MGALAAIARMLPFLSRAGTAASQSIDALRNNIPQLDDQVTVEVTGNPGTTKQQLYFLALATANGIVRRFATLEGSNIFQPPPMGLLMIEYDAADNWVRCVMQYRCGMLSVIAPPTGGPGLERLAVYRGPQCDVNGGTFDFTNILLPGIPASSNAPSAPILPLTGQPILTQCPTVKTPQPTVITQDPAPSQPVTSTGPVINSPNPKPAGDNRSRGVMIVPPAAGGFINANPKYGSNSNCCSLSKNLIPLVYAALTDPGSAAYESVPGPTSGPEGV